MEQDDEFDVDELERVLSVKKPEEKYMTALFKLND